MMDAAAAEQARKRWDQLTKPQGSLGRLEELGIRLASITGRPIPSLERKLIFTAAGDHGVVQEGVSAYPQSVTVQMVLNFLRGGAGINVLARYAGAEVKVIDAGVAGDLDHAPDLVRCRIRPGTGNMAREASLSRDEAQRIVAAGEAIFEQAHQEKPIGLAGLGDMGIGNTTAASALTAVFTGQPVSQITGRGTGLADVQRFHKVEVIQQALDLHRPDPKDPLGCLAAVGGLEIGCLAGICLAAARARVPIVLDGFITTAAAVVAERIDPKVRDCLIASHRSAEPGHSALLAHLGLEPLLDLQLRLGEGTGAALAFLLLEASVRLLSEMATFDEAGVDRKKE